MLHTPDTGVLIQIIRLQKGNNNKFSFIYNYANGVKEIDERCVLYKWCNVLYIPHKA